MAAPVYIGTAAWSIPSSQRTHFPFQGSHLEKYAHRFQGVEINSSFYKMHKVATYERWRDSVPDHFKFSVKLFKFFTHAQRLRIGNLSPNDPTLGEALAGPLALKEKLGPLLVQLPPSLNLEIGSAENFFSRLRDLYSGPVAFEPRHGTWTQPEAQALMQTYNLSPVLADPQVLDHSTPSSTLVYYRLHGSPLIYKSSYIMPRLNKYAREIKFLSERVQSIWCIFDNTTYGYATANAMSLQEILGQRPSPSAPLASTGGNAYI